MMRKSGFYSFIFILLSGGILFYPFPLSAGSISIESVLGFDGIFALNRWTPLTITIENQMRAIEGRLEVITVSGSAYHQKLCDIKHTMDISLPRHAKKRYSFTIRLNSIYQPVFIRIRKGGELIAEKRVVLKRNMIEKKMIVYADERKNDVLLPLVSEDLYSITIREDFLPESYYAYDGVALLILKPRTISGLNERQLSAVLGFVNTGGQLLISGGLNKGFYSSENMSALFKMQRVFIETPPEIKALADFCGEKLTSDQPFGVVRVETDVGEVILSEKDLPILIQRKVGRGVISFFAVSIDLPPFNQWPHRSLFFKNLIEDQSQDISLKKWVLDETIAAAITRESFHSFPDFRMAFFIMTLYGASVIWISAKMRKREEKKRNFYVFMFFFLNFISCVLFFLLYIDQKNSGVTHSGFFHLKLMDHDQVAMGKYTFGLFSMNSETVNIRVGDHPVMPILFPKSVPGTKREVTLYHAFREKRLLIDNPSWSKSYFSMNLPYSLSLKGEAVFMKDHLFINIINQTGLIFSDCSFYWKGDIFHLGDLNQEISKPYSFPKVLQTHSENKVFPFEVPFVRGSEQTLLKGPAFALYENVKIDLSKELVLSIHEMYENRDDVICLFGWAQSDLISITKEKQPLKGHHISFLQWEIPIKKGKAQ